MKSPLTQILSPTLPQTDLTAANPAWTRADFQRTVFHLSGRLKAQNIATAALWFEDAALFACAVLAAWHAGARVLLPPNLARENLAKNGINYANRDAPAGSAASVRVGDRVIAVDRSARRLQLAQRLVAAHPVVADAGRPDDEVDDP